MKRVGYICSRTTKGQGLLLPNWKGDLRHPLNLQLHLKHLTFGAISSLLLKPLETTQTLSVMYKWMETNEEKMGT